MTKTEIANLALGHLGVGRSISSIETERSEEALACKAFYQISLEIILETFPWPFASAIEALGLVSEDTAIDAEYRYAYRLPSDCIRPIRILNGSKYENRQTRVPYDVIKDDAGELILTDKEDALFKYVDKTVDNTNFTPKFTMALSYLLASYIAPRISKGDLFGMKQKMMASYKAELVHAQADVLNSKQDREAAQSELLRARY